MASRYVQQVNNNATRFSQAPMADLEFSTMTANPTLLTTFNAGDIIPVYCAEVLPHDTFDFDLNFVIRQTTALYPTMGQMTADFYAFFVPNRVVNQSWKNVQGENTSGSWVAPQVDLVGLVGDNEDSLARNTQVPVGSVADYYGFPTQAPIPNTVLAQCNDLKFRGYVEIYNQYFRDQNYQPPIPYSKLNIYNGFFDPVNSIISVIGRADEAGADGTGAVSVVNGLSLKADGSTPYGAFVKAFVGDGGKIASNYLHLQGRKTSFSALDKPLKANKLHDYFTSVLPSPQKGATVSLAVGDYAPIKAGSSINLFDNAVKFTNGSNLNQGLYNLAVQGSNDTHDGTLSIGSSSSTSGGDYSAVLGSNLVADLKNSTSLSINDIRESIALQQVYECLARGGSRYYSFINSFFGLDIDNPFDDIPTYLGHFRRDLDLYQVAQTSPETETPDGAISPQGNLSAYGYTANGGSMFHKTFLEHGYIHIMMVVRHRNVYASYLASDNFRRSMLDFYLPQLSNLSEQPVLTRSINPFYNSKGDQVFGYQEAWAEYRYEPDRVSGLMRPGVDGSLAMWNYADDFDSSLAICDNDWLKSNSEQVLNRSVAVNSSLAPQFKGQFTFFIKKERPMPVFSVPGLDIF